VVARCPDLPGCAVRLIYTAEPYVEAAVRARLRPHGILSAPHMNKSDLNAIKDIIDSALGTHLASVHEEITDLRNEMTQDMSKVETTLTARIDRLEAKIDHVDEKLGNFENREIDRRLQLEVRVERLEKQRF
jgi:tRNA U34 5-carboxymethylaminomethyl modifying GTPase MnmE/TrmE